MSLSELDPILTPPKRVTIIALLYGTVRIDFGYLKAQLQLSDSDLSKQMSALADAGYVIVTKTKPGRGGATSYRITGAGRHAFERHRAALERLLNPTPGPQVAPDAYRARD